MRKYLKNTAALALVFTTATVMAREPKISVVPQEDSKSVVLRLDTNAEETNIKFIDNDLRTLYSNRTTEAKYRKKFNLKDLKKGTYYLEIENDEKSVRYTLGVKENDITVVKEQERTEIPVLRKVGSKIYLNLLNEDLNTVRVKVFNSKDQEVENQIFSDRLTVGEVYNFEKALKDSYTVVVQDGTKTYRQSISVQ